MPTDETVFEYKPAAFPPGLLAIPAGDWMWTESALSIIALSRSLPPQSNLSVGHLSSSPAANRNMLAMTFLANPALEWIAFVDSDMTPAPVTVLRLLSHQRDIVGALCFQRNSPYHAAFRDLPGGPTYCPETGLREVTMVGTGCMLVRRNVLETIPYPWFEHPVPGNGEDTVFCLKAREAGFSVYCDDLFCVGHIGALAIDEEVVEQLQNVPAIRAHSAALIAGGDSRSPQATAEEELRYDEILERSRAKIEQRGTLNTTKK